MSDVRELVYDRDEPGPGRGDVLWVFEVSDTKQRIAVLNPRWGADADDEGNTIWCVEHDGWTIDGRQPTDDEDTELYDFVYDAVKEILRR